MTLRKYIITINGKRAGVLDASTMQRAINKAVKQTGAKRQTVRATLASPARNPGQSQIATVVARGNKKVFVTATNSEETNAQLLDRVNAVRVIKRVNTNPAPSEWEDEEFSDEELNEASRQGWLGAQAMRREHTKRAQGPKHFDVTWYSPLRKKRTGFIRPIEAHTAADAKRQAKAMVENDPKASNFIAKEVTRNPKRAGDAALLTMQLGAQRAQSAAEAAKQKHGYGSARHKAAELAYKKASQRYQRAKAHATKKRNGIAEAAAGLQALEYLGGKVKAGGKPHYKINASRGSRDALGVWHKENPGRYAVKTGQRYRLEVVADRKSDNAELLLAVIDSGNKPELQAEAARLLKHFESEQNARAYIIDYQKGRITWRAGSRKRKRRNPSVQDVSKMFQGKASGAVSEMRAANSAPADLARIGKFVFLQVEGQRRPLRIPGAMVAADTKGRLWIVGNRTPLLRQKAKPGEALDFGEVARICYDTAKAHIGEGKRFEYVHDFGEDGGKRPHLLVDSEGMPILRGGDYKIEARGIVN